MKNCLMQEEEEKPFWIFELEMLNRHPDGDICVKTLLAKSRIWRHGARPCGTEQCEFPIYLTSLNFKVKKRI